MDDENRTEGDLTRLSGNGEEKGEEGAAGHVKAQSEEGAVREARGAVGSLSNQRKRDIAARVNKIVHQFGGPDTVFALIADGKPITHIANDMEITTIEFYAWAEKTPERSRALAHARELAAHRLAEQGLEIVDNATPQTANLANIQSKYRQWLAGKWNQQAYGENKAQVNVQVNITDAHLMANRYRETVNAVNVDDKTIDVAPHNG